VQTVRRQLAAPIASRTQRRAPLGFLAISPDRGAFRDGRADLRNRPWRVRKAKEKAPAQRQRAGTRRVSRCWGLTRPIDESPRLAGRELSSKGDARAARPCGASHHLALRSVAARIAFPSASVARPRGGSRFVGRAAVLTARSRASMRRARGKPPVPRVSFEPRHISPRNRPIYGVHPPAAGPRSRRGTGEGRLPSGTRAVRRPRDRGRAR
jgi:hypothetical protein